MKKALLLICLIALLSVVFARVVPVFAQSIEDQLKEKQKQIQDLQNKVNDLRNQDRTLTTQVTDMNSKIKLTQLKIETTKDLIQQLESDILILGGKIDGLEGKLQDVSEVLLNRVVVGYKTSQADPVALLFAKNGFGDSYTKSEYIKIAQQHDRELLFEMEQTKMNYNNQKDVLSSKQEEQKQLSAQLESLNNDLAQQKVEKEKLLQVTRSDESKYQQLLAAALAEKNAMENAMSITLTDGKAIKKGDPIAIIGNSGSPGCSTGPHLHFEVRKDKNMQNPADYLKNQSVSWDNSPDGSFSFNGSMDWPIDSPRITQGYGMTYWARTGFYGGGPHTGIDMISDTSSVIKAPVDGTVYKGSTSCKGSSMNYVAIDQGNGIVTWYWHVK